MTALIIAARELRERGRLFAICAALAVIPFLAAMFPGARNDRADAIGAVSGFLAMAMALGSAAAFGGSTVMRDVAERRLSFYFSRPISPSALWIGKATASIVASQVCFAIIALPSVIAIRDAWPALWMLTAREVVLGTAVGVVVLFFLSHILSSVIRSRSVLIAVDFVMTVILAASLLVMARALFIGAAVGLLRSLAVVIGVSMLVVMAVAPIWQLRNGRTDIRRSHAALSRFLWPAIFAVVAVVGGYVLWVVSASPADLSRVLLLEQSPRAEWFVAGGGTKARGDYHASFLIDGKGGWKRLRMAPWSDVVFSRNGRVVLWSEPAGLFDMGEVELHTARGATGIRTRAYTATALADDGSRIAVARDRLVAVHDVATGKLVVSAGGFDPRLAHRMFFVSNDVVRVIELTYRSEGGPFRIFEIDIPRRKVIRTADTSLPVAAIFTASHDGSRILLRRQRRVIDGRTAATILDLPEVETSSAALLGDGRLVETFREGKASRLRVYGGPEVVIPIAFSSIAGELADGKLLVRGTGQTGWSATGADRSQFVVDLARGEIVQTVPEVKTGDAGWSLDPRLARYETARIVGVDREGKLIWWDPGTGGISGAGGSRR